MLTCRQTFDQRLPVELSYIKLSFLADYCPASLFVVILKVIKLPGQAALQCFQVEHGLVCNILQNSISTARLQCSRSAFTDLWILQSDLISHFYFNKRGLLESREYTEKLDWLNSREFSLVWWLAFFPRVILSWIAWFLPAPASPASRWPHVARAGSAAEMEWRSQGAAPARLSRQPSQCRETKSAMCPRTPPLSSLGPVWALQPPPSLGLGPALTACWPLL